MPRRHRAVVWAGLILTLFFVCPRALRAAHLPVRLRQYRAADGLRFVKQQAPSAAHLFGNERDVDRRAVARHLRRSDGGRGRAAVVAPLARRRAPARAHLRVTSGGKLDRVLLFCSWMPCSLSLALFAIVIAFLLSETFGRGVVTAALAISVVYIPQYFRVVRNHVISVREEPYVEAARALGAKPRTIIRKYVLQNVIQNVPVIATLNAADADPHPGGARLPRVRDPADRGGRVGLRHPARHLRRGSRDLVDRPVPRPGDRVARHRPHPGRRGPERRAQPGDPQTCDPEGCPRRRGRRARRDRVSHRGPRPARVVRHVAQTRASGRRRLARDRVPARRSAWSASRAAASRRSAGR